MIRTAKREYSKECLLILMCLRICLLFTFFTIYKRVIEDRRVLTPDLGGNASTKRVIDEIISEIKNSY